MSDGCVKHERLTGVCLECLEVENERLRAALQEALEKLNWHESLARGEEASSG